MKNLFLITVTFAVNAYASDAENINITVKMPKPRGFIGEYDRCESVTMESNQTPASATSLLQKKYSPNGILVITDKDNMAKDVSGVTNVSLQALRYFQGTSFDHISFLSEPNVPFDKYNH